MGPRALTLSGGEYAIHGTNRPESIGTFASYSSIRMYNEDIPGGRSYNQHGSASARKAE